VLGRYSHEHTKRWAAKIAEWNDKAAGFVSYGAVGGARAVEHLRLVMGNLRVADVTTRWCFPFSPTSRACPCFGPTPGTRRSRTPCSTR